jgi:hypothetical protein
VEGQVLLQSLILYTTHPISLHLNGGSSYPPISHVYNSSHLTSSKQETQVLLQSLILYTTHPISLHPNLSLKFSSNLSFSIRLIPSHSIPTGGSSSPPISHSLYDSSHLTPSKHPKYILRCLYKDLLVSGHW